MRESVSQLAAAAGADTAAIVEIQAQERTKTGYALIRDIGTVSGPGVLYQFALNDTLKQALAQGRTILILQYADDPGIFLFPEITALTADTITIRTLYPTGTFAFLIL